MPFCCFVRILKNHARNNADCPSQFSAASSIQLRIPWRYGVSRRAGPAWNDTGPTTSRPLLDRGLSGVETAHQSVGSVAGLWCCGTAAGRPGPPGPACAPGVRCISTPAGDELMRASSADDFDSFRVGVGVQRGGAGRGSATTPTRCYKGAGPMCAAISICVAAPRARRPP